ncbi:MAG: alkaline phosphatase family protein [Bryobacteraceae bacterium]
MRAAFATLIVIPVLAVDFRPPAGNQPAVLRPGASSILPGGRVISPLGKHYLTGPGPFGIAMSPSGKRVVTANGGPNRYALTVVDLGKDGAKTRHFVAPRKREEAEDEDDADWRSVFQGLAFVDDNLLFASEGNSGRIRQVDLRSGKRKLLFDLNGGGFADSYTGDLAYDPRNKRLYVADQANFRVAIIDTASRKVVSSIRTGRLPFALALTPDGKRLVVTHVGMFEYSPVPGADPKKARETGLAFPAFGFPSPESMSGAKRETAVGAVDVPGLGDPNAPESNSVAVIDVADAASPKIAGRLRTGLPFPQSLGGSSPSGVTVTSDRIYVSNAHNDSVTVVDAGTLQPLKEILLRIPSLERYRGLIPIGSYFDEPSGWLLVACAGINALAVIDAKQMQVIGYLPTAWFPTRVLVRDSRVFVACAKGNGTGPNANRGGPLPGSFQGERRRGSIVEFALPDSGELRQLTARVLFNNGIFTRKEDPAPLPAEIEHVVVIVKENRTFDEVFGDIETAANGPVAGIPILARFGKYGVIGAERGELQRRLLVRNISVTPNHHALAERFAFSDNFYADSEVSVDGHHWMVGAYPNAWTESTLMASYGGQKDFRMPTTAPGRLLFAQSNSSVHPEEQLEAGALWHHLERNGVPFRNWGEGFELAGMDEGEGLKPTGGRYMTNVPMPDPLYRNTSRTYPNYNMNIPDQFRADQFIREVDEMFVKPEKPLPHFLYIHLPNDHTAKPRPEDGYPFQASYVADNDYALGRIIEYLSHTKWWPKMAIFITEDDAQGGVDHIDSHRTVLLVVSPWAKRNYVSHVNASFPSILKTAFRLLKIPPLNLYDAAAADLADCFSSSANMEPYKVRAVPAEVFDPAKAREPMDPKPGPAMDDPKVLREQHRR